jgi:hypothetical protein
MTRADIVNATKAARAAKTLDAAVDVIVTRVVQVAQRDAADHHAKHGAAQAYAPLASAMRKMLPAPLLKDVIAHLDPLGEFVKVLRGE